MPQVPQRGLLNELTDVSGSLFTRPFEEQYGAICFRHHPDTGEAQVLLVTSRDTGRWVIPKGWPMKGKKPHKAAATEAWEEAGVVGKAHKKPIGRFTYLKRLQKGRSVPCVVVVHLVSVDTIAEDFREKGQRRSQWMSCHEAARSVREPELKSILSGLEPKLEAFRVPLTIVTTSAAARKP